MNRRVTRLTFIVTPEIEAEIQKLKQEVYFDRTQSEMIRDLVAAGVRSRKAQSERADAEMKNA